MSGRVVKTRIVAAGSIPVEDDLVAHLLLLHGLHPVPIERRVLGDEGLGGLEHGGLLGGGRSAGVGGGGAAGKDECAGPSRRGDGPAHRESYLATFLP